MNSSQRVSLELWHLATRDAGLGVGHVWYLTQCPAYRTLNPSECTCGGEQR